MNVLIVEDEWIVSEEIKISISECGFNVVGQIDDGCMVSKLIEVVEVDLVLMDININGDKNGIELAKFIQKRISCFIIFISALDNKAQTKELDGLVNYDFLPKPFSVEGLHRILKKNDLNTSREEGS